MSVREITTAICNRGQLLFCRNALQHHRGQGDVGDRASRISARRGQEGFPRAQGRDTSVSGDFFPSCPKAALSQAGSKMGKHPGAGSVSKAQDNRLVILGSQQVSESFCTISFLPNPQTVFPCQQQTHYFS